MHKYKARAYLRLIDFNCLKWMCYKNLLDSKTQKMRNAAQS